MPVCGLLRKMSMMSEYHGRCCIAGVRDTTHGPATSFGVCEMAGGLACQPAYERAQLWFAGAEPSFGQRALGIWLVVHTSKPIALLSVSHSFACNDVTTLHSLLLSRTFSSSDSCLWEISQSA